jgi:hypothetical protein
MRCEGRLVDRDEECRGIKWRDCLVLQDNHQEHEQGENGKVEPAVAHHRSEPRQFLLPHAADAAQRRIRVDLHYHGNVEQQGWDGRREGDLAVVLAQKRRHHEGRRAHYGRHQHGASRRDRLDRARIGRREAGALHGRDRHDARTHHV